MLEMISNEELFHALYGPDNSWTCESEEQNDSHKFTKLVDFPEITLLKTMERGVCFWILIFRFGGIDN